MDTGSSEHGRRLSVIGAPSSAGAYGPGQERAPATFRAHGLVPALAGAGLEVTDRGDGPLTPWRRDEQSPLAGNVGLVADVARTLADTVAGALGDGHDVLVLGGDCTVELGTVAGALRDGSTVGLVYVDLDADLNTPETGDGVLDWMGVAHMLDVAGAHPGLVSLSGQRPMLDVAAVRLFGTHSVSAPEQAVIDRLDMQVESLDAVVDDLEAVLARTRGWAADFDRLLVHVDADVLDHDRLPIAENTDSRGGLDLATLTRLLRGLCALPAWRALTLTEINPGHALDERQAFHRLVSMLTEALTPTAAPAAS